MLSPSFAYRSPTPPPPANAWDRLVDTSRSLPVPASRSAPTAGALDAKLVEDPDALERMARVTPSSESGVASA